MIFFLPQVFLWLWWKIEAVNERRGFIFIKWNTFSLYYSVINFKASFCRWMNVTSSAVHALSPVLWVHPSLNSIYLLKNHWESDSEFLSKVSQFSPFPGCLQPSHTLSFIYMFYWIGFKTGIVSNVHCMSQRLALQALMSSHCFIHPISFVLWKKAFEPFCLPDILIPLSRLQSCLKVQITPHYCHRPTVLPSMYLIQGLIKTPYPHCIT